VENKILKTELVNWKDISMFQPKGLKNMSEIQLKKLKTSLKNNGFKTPFYVWESKGKLYCLDGHHRIPAMKLLEEDGEIIPEKLPANFIDCKNKKEAKKAVLVFNSHYANIVQDVLQDWISDLNLNELKNEIDVNIFKEKKDTISKDNNFEEIDLSHELEDDTLYNIINSYNTIYVMFSGGKDSMALVADLLKNNIDKNKMKLLFNKTPLDYPDLEEFVLDFASANKISVDVIGKTYSDDEISLMFERNGFPLPYMSWCTGTWKVQPMNDYLKNVDKEKVILCQGWRREESKQREGSSFLCMHGRHKIKMARPILNYKEQDVYDIIKKFNWNLHYSYKYKSRLGCIYCHSINRQEWKDIKENDPEIFFRALGFVTDGFISKNITGIECFNKIREMFDKDSIKSSFGEDLQKDESLNAIRRMLSKDTIKKRRSKIKNETEIQR